MHSLRIICSVSPAITLPSAGTLSLQYKIGSNDTTYFAEHYAVYVLPASATTFAGTETPVVEGTLTTPTATAKSIDITSLAGQSVKIYFRHYNCTDQNILLLDDMAVIQTTSLGTNETATETTAISLYPNPASDSFEIKSKEKVKSVSAVDVSGKLIPLKENSGKYDATTLQSGSYIIKIQTENSETTKKLIKK